MHWSTVTPCTVPLYVLICNTHNQPGRGKGHDCGGRDTTGGGKDTTGGGRDTTGRGRDTTGGGRDTTGGGRDIVKTLIFLASLNLPPSTDF